MPGHRVDWRLNYCAADMSTKKTGRLGGVTRRRRRQQQQQQQQRWGREHSANLCEEAFHPEAGGESKRRPRLRHCFFLRLSLPRFLPPDCVWPTVVDARDAAAHRCPPPGPRLHADPGALLSGPCCPHDCWTHSRGRALFLPATGVACGNHPRYRVTDRVTSLLRFTGG